ncbi:NUDIX hydrolase [Sutcliffiella rhizosphaerae]|uniref:NADH pyrophosphatase n=1 Tax=Sutcliffiella rhizosphaerae TaxID=2880967 RepID=A0ABM8YH88_9BACI|nr:NUDIX hydrolase [Sutcliffiella rhizosphaerae]CAG9619243.1 NADH pyrophosphatase [Sutcliffiella rhizosphaerae]
MKRVDVAYVLLFDEMKEKVLMVKNKGSNGSYFTLPGGAVEAGETLQQAAVREVREETGLDVNIHDVFTIQEAFFEDRGHHVIFFLFTGSISGGKINISMPDEIEDVTWMKVDEAESYIYLTNQPINFSEKISTVPYLLRKKTS